MRRAQDHTPAAAVIVALLAAIITGLPVTVHADGIGIQPNPQLQIGIGVGGVRFPYYPGAAEDRTLLLPFPYVVYHSRYLDVDREKLRGKLLGGPRLSLEVDFGGAVAVPSSDVPERQGMPNLDWIGQVGPALRYHIWGNASHAIRMDLVMPLRAAVSAHGLTLHHRGYVFAPRLELGYHTGEEAHAFDIGASVTALYGNRDYFQYIYGVAPEYATAQRPAYAASGGYGGYTLEVGGSLHRGDMVYGTFLSYTNLSGANFIASPLVSRSDGLTFGVMLAWIFQRSSN